MPPSPSESTEPSADAPSRRDVAAAGHVGDRATARRGLAAADPELRALALGALDRLGALDDGDLRSAIDDPSPVVRRRAATLGVRHRSIDLGRLLDDDDPSVVEEAAFATGEHGSTAGRPLIDRLIALGTDHDDPLVREAAVAALGAIGDPTGLPTILAATEDKPAIRRRAVLALAPFDGPDVDAAIERARHDRDWQVRQAAEDLLSP